MPIPKMVFLFIIFILQSSFAFGSGTVVGNGGEPILHFLQATRFAMVETLKDIHLDPKINASFCREETDISKVQQQFCHDYLMEILDQMIALNIEPHQVPFVLREVPIFVTGPDGKPMPVSAKTQLGSDGPIEFHLDSIKLMAPQLVFHLISHEFQHKSTYRGNNPTDNDPIGPFQRGRTLIDSVASAITKVAVKTGRVGTAFILRDSFQCLIRSGTGQFEMRAATQRWFFDSSLVNYKLSLSEQPSDPLIAVPDSPNSKIVFQLDVTDSNDCANMENTGLRQSRVSLWRSFDDPSAAPVLLSDQKFAGLNPLCEKNPHLFSADFQSIHFECKYYGTSAQ